MTDLRTFDRLVGDALKSGDEAKLRDAYSRLNVEREARVAAAATDADVRDVEQLAALQARVSGEVSQLREDRTAARVAAARALPPVVLPERSRPRRVLQARHYVRRR